MGWLTRTPTRVLGEAAPRALGRIAQVILLATLLITSLTLLAAPVSAFSGIGALTADAVYGRQMTFRVTLGSTPERLELLLRFGGDDNTFVAPVRPAGGAATYVWDAAQQYVTPNTRITYRWRATSAGIVSLSPEGTLVYADNRPGLDWHSTQLGEATVHWYGGAEAQAREFGALAASGARSAEGLLGHDLAGPVDIFVYDSRADFFGALGPGAREWTGAATFPNIRTIFMWLGGGPPSYLRTAVVHEVTHVVFYDATNNPYHDPARWLNEGLARWSERQSADQERRLVASETSQGLFSFEALTGQFPIGERGSSLSYAEGATMVDMIARQYGRGAIARIATAYRTGATDEEALRAGTGRAAADLYAAYFGQYGTAVPKPISPEPLLPATAGGRGSTNAQPPAPTASPSPTAPRPVADPISWALLLAVGMGGAALVSGALWLRRRAGRRGAP